MVNLSDRQITSNFLVYNLQLPYVRYGHHGCYGHGGHGGYVGPGGHRGHVGQDRTELVQSAWLWHSYDGNLIRDRSVETGQTIKLDFPGYLWLAAFTILEKLSLSLKSFEDTLLNDKSKIADQ